ncbi:helix-turn-helix domain-containing protein [Pyxidicoccus sp. MSG2]|uniref:helix-turn-helix domain-containing protein n=1 Tax=Pyxidicoccus sp. MSG2 TaxID=2996790 RepID=UPI002270818B|nr:helix-turn-helix domain-containing protein [Pyxidicoccus sp. MSG2]MCY1014280.1 helix-turn-helix domain-containing protein [Pyxidicoccus sp. MSG2]
MKPFEQQTYYELLEVPVSAPVDDIRAAYSRLMELYAPDSIAVYALVDPEQVDGLRARMTEAMEILTDADLRAEYDKDLGLPTRRMAEAVTAGGKPSPEATPAAGTVERAAEALASSASAEVDAGGPGEGTATAAPVAREPEVVEQTSTATPPPSEAATSPVAPPDFRATFFRGFSFAYVSSSLQDSQFLGSSVHVPTASTAIPVAAATEPAQAPVPMVSAAAVAVAEAVPAASAPSVSVASTTEPVTAPTPPVEPTAVAVAPEPAPEVATWQSAPTAPAPESTALATVPGRKEGTPAPVFRPGARTPSTRTPTVVPASDPGRPAPRPGPGRQLGDAQVLSQDSAIATAEAALAQVAARVREQRPRTPDIPADAEFNGELLRRVREARSFSLQQVADRTRISKAHLENVEADRYTALPPPVYLRGILMNLARELGLDPLRVSRSYLALASEKSGKK